MSPKTFEMAIRQADETNGIREFSVAELIFTYVQKYFMALLPGAIAPIDFAVM